MLLRTIPKEFRVWNTLEGKWVHPDDVVEDFYISLQGGVYTYDYVPNAKMHKMNSTWKQLAVQYTGLKDKNGNKIFEGDILKCKDKVGLVSYDHESAGYMFKTKGKCSFSFQSLDKYEVIGNIFENEDLLK